MMRWKTDNTSSQALDSADAQLAGTTPFSPVAKGRYAVWRNGNGAIKSLTLYDSQTSALRIIPVPTAGHDVRQYDFTVSGGVPVIFFWTGNSISTLPIDLRLNRWTEADGVTTIAYIQVTSATPAAWSIYGPSVLADGDSVAYHLLDATPGSISGLSLQMRPVTLAGTPTEIAPQAGRFQFRDGVLAWQGFTGGKQYLNTWTQARGATVLGEAPGLNAIGFAAGSGYVAYKLASTGNLYTWQASSAATAQRAGANTLFQPFVTDNRLYYTIGSSIYRQVLN
jgi:hypothetical protein